MRCPLCHGEDIVKRMADASWSVSFQEWVPSYNEASRTPDSFYCYDCMREVDEPEEIEYDDPPSED